MNEKPPPREQQPLVNLQLYQPPMPPKPKPQQPNQYYSVPYMDPVNGQTHLFMPPIVKQVNISTDGPTADHRLLARVYEDVLPTKHITAGGGTLSDRLNIYQFVRSSIFSNKDGEDISLDAVTGGVKSILSYIKFGELNPYNSGMISENPYTDLPKNFLIYKSCYPIRGQLGVTKCSKNTTSANIRLYNVSEGSYSVKRTNIKDFASYDEWREIAFYEYIREKILKKKVCPHFPTLFGYFISTHSGVSFNHKKWDEIGFDRNTEPATVEILDNVTNEPVQISNPNSYKGKTLVAMTESATYSLINWTCLTYNEVGTTRTMVNRGVHSNDEWMNILFQIMVALYTLQMHHISIDNFSVEKNVLIKDLPTKGSVINHWKYKINNVDFYLPNLGYLVLIDSNFKDTGTVGMEEGSFMGRNADPVHKLNGEFIDVYNDLSVAEKQNSIRTIRNDVFEMFKKVFTTNIFNERFNEIGGCRPNIEIENLLTSISNAASTGTQTNIFWYIITYMGKYLHNRTGTYLKTTEVDNIKQSDTRQMEPGQMVVQAEQAGTYKFVIYLGINDGNAQILTKDDPNDNDVIISQITISSLMNYTRSEPIQQSYKPNESNLSEDDVLETYVVKK
jgi:hypothetical protein